MKRSLTVFLCWLFGLALLTVTSAQSQTVRTRASHAVIVDLATGAKLYGKNEDVPVPPASMSKLMTVGVVLDLIKQGKISTETSFEVSEKAWRTGGSKMFVLVGTEITVEDLLKGIVVQSGNDACIVVAENIAGNEEAFAELMNARAKAWGLTASSFANPTGLPHPEQRMSMQDLATLSRHLWTSYPNFRYLFSIPQFTWSNITQTNRNPLIGTLPGAMGMKTGHTDEAGYGVVGLAEQNGVGRIIVVSGLKSETERRAAAFELMEQAFDHFEDKRFFKSGDVVGEAMVFAGQREAVPLRIEQDVAFILNKAKATGAKAELSYDGPLRAPVLEGERVAVLKLTIPGETPREYPLYTAASVTGISPWEKVRLGLVSLLTPPEEEL